MKAKIQPFIGKYYGTVIEISNGDLYRDAIVVSYSGGPPSQRQLDQYGLKLSDQGSEAWRDLFSDDHYETAQTLQIAEAIVKALENLELK